MWVLPKGFMPLIPSNQFHKKGLQETTTSPGKCQVYQAHSPQEQAPKGLDLAMGF